MTAPDPAPDCDDIYWRLVDLLGQARDVTIAYTEDGHSVLTHEAQAVLAHQIAGDAKLGAVVPGADVDRWRCCVVSAQQQVTEFHCAFGVAVAQSPTPELRALRATLITEETRETVAALASGDLTEIAQELADLVYVAYGSAISLGIDLDAAVTEVHRANMSKLGADGLPVLRGDGKVLKGPNYRPPNMAAVVGGAP